MSQTIEGFALDMMLVAAMRNDADDYIRRQAKKAKQTWGKQSDLDNPVKPIMDILQKRYGFNDAQVMHYQLIKKIVPKGSEYIAFSIKRAD